MGILSEFTSLTRLKQVYQTWDVRVVILLSLFLQIFLIFSAPFRKRTSNSFIMVPMWLAYLLADATATFGIGLIASTDQSVSVDTRILYAFWSPFLLLHLGGPDTITAFALEDNELWLRHLLQLGFHTGTCVYILSLVIHENRLLLPTLLVFSAGLIKYYERTRCLFLASSRRLQQTSLGEPDPGPSYDRLVDYFNHKTEASIPTTVEIIPKPSTSRLPNRGKEAMPLSDLDVVSNAHSFYRGSKGLIADLVLNFDERNESRVFFQSKSPGDAFRVIEVELNFYYDILYTKAVVVHRKFGYFQRFISFALSVASLLAFYLIHKRGFHTFDVGVTYSLLVGAIFLESVALLIVFLSDWTAVSLSGLEDSSQAKRVMNKIVNVNRIRWAGDKVPLPFSWLTQIIRRRWSGSISQYNLIRCSLNPLSRSWENISGFFGLAGLLDEIKYVETVKWEDKLKGFIFEELKMKSELADDLITLKDLYTAKGDWVLRFESHMSLLPWITKVDFDESLLLWHVATELCFHDDDDSSKASQGKELYSLAKILSDYMLYLLLIKSTVMSTVAGIGQIRFRDTCAEARRFFDDKNFLPEEQKGDKMDRFQRQACLEILKVDTLFKSGHVKGDSCKSVLFDACKLAKELRNLRAEKWEIICKVWVEMLCYAACRCKGSTHMQEIGKGGQLITLVWMLMSHLGLGNQFQISDFQSRAVLTVAK